MYSSSSGGRATFWRVTASVMLLGFMPEAATRWRFRVDSYLFPIKGTGMIESIFVTHEGTYISYVVNS